MLSLTWCGKSWFHLVLHEPLIPPPYADNADLWLVSQPRYLPLIGRGSSAHILGILKYVCSWQPCYVQLLLLIISTKCCIVAAYVCRFYFHFISRELMWHDLVLFYLFLAAKGAALDSHSTICGVCSHHLWNIPVN